MYVDPVTRTTTLLAVPEQKDCTERASVQRAFFFNSMCMLFFFSLLFFLSRFPKKNCDRVRVGEGGKQEAMTSVLTVGLIKRHAIGGTQENDVTTGQRVITPSLLLLQRFLES